MMRTALATVMMLTLPASAQTLDAQIGRHDPGKLRDLSAVHGGAGTMRFAGLLGPDALSTNLIFVHRGVIAPKSSIGQHFHNQCEEMFVILDGEAQFTVDGRTSTIKGPAAVPDRMGHSHAIYNPTDKPLQWLNINVGITKAYDNFDLGDTREGAALDRVPQFISMRFDRALLKPLVGSTGAWWRRALGSEIFATTWSYVDHLLLAPGGRVPSAAKAGMSEMLYVIGGAGEVEVAGERAAIRAGDAIPVEVGRARAIRQTGAVPLELMIVGVARDQAAKAAFAAAARPAR
ncbi:MAG TPA: mannose-6-phosphate isomerase [Sphingomonas bacterium]|jgi:mannose-6-phosphate isomerase-like protein (cupin superfamily)|uniref:Mannose-6-phosphate isomerase n=1 Tax=Sphingomonas bacterium TaxID=1895847 RepID=A0A3D0WBM1_9SPHN|nr:mannose-6-phosphate isomerase [Sphingomonas bacterium]